MKALILLSAFLLFLLAAPTVLAVNVNILQAPSSITSDIFNVQVSITGASDGQNYLRVDLYKDGTSEYFGETFNGSQWYSSSDGKQYFPVTISSSSAQANIQARIGNPTSTEYAGSGNYKLKIRRYTASGNAATSDTQTPVDISIYFATPTPSPTPGPTSKPTSTPTPLPTPSKTPTPDTKASITKARSEDTITPIDSVLGSKTSSTDTPTSSKKIIVAGQNGRNIIGFIFIILGLVFMVTCGIVVFWSFKKSKENL